MAEIAKVVFNYLGLAVYIMGIFANLNNIISVTLGFVGIAFGVVKILIAYENYLMKRIDRKEKESKKYEEDEQ
jgi:cytochrome c biogenesis protein CcdA